MYYIGVDLGGTNIAVGIVDTQGKILCQGETPTLAERPYQEVLADMAALIQQVVKESGFAMTDMHSVGVGSPGVCNSKEGVVVFANNLYWHHVPVREELQKIINLPVHLDNDATVAGLAEYFCGACQGADNAIVITLGTGLGSGIIFNGKPFSGSHGTGGELGHLIVEVDGIQCTCGNKGCLERYASATALIREGREAVGKNPNSLIARMVEGDMDRISAKVVLDAARGGDPVAGKIFHRYIHYLAMGIITMINFTDPEIIAIGGGVSRAGDFLLDALKREIEQNIVYKDIPYAHICMAQLGNEAGIIGAAMLGRL